MVRYILFRLFWMIPTLIGVSLVIFILMHNTPGSPLDPVGANNPLPPDAQQNLAHKWGLDQPLWRQYLTYVSNAAHFDFGESYNFRGQRVGDILKRGFPISLFLGSLAMAFAIGGGVVLGVIAAARQNGPADYFCTLLATFGVAIPNFSLAIFLVFIFVLKAHWLPHTGGWNGPDDWILPALALGLGPLGIIARYVRSSMVEVIRSDYVRTARAKGASERRVIVNHVIKNGMIPPLTIIGPLFAAIATGNFAIEYLFRVPGIGKLFVTSILARDYPMILSVILLYAVFLAVMNLVVDLLYGVVDPRIRYT
jgi:peptide/nickel transport system permease protein